MSPAFTHHVDIRYGECDQQGVVFNANYLAYVDDTMDHWMRSFASAEWTSGWDVMLKAARVLWHAPARWPERLAVGATVSRWGRTSFDVHYALAVGDRRVADVVITYVSIEPSTAAPTPPPDSVVAAMGPAAPLPDALR
jgi:acyl-CoA thioester hydrolase